MINAVQEGEYLHGNLFWYNRLICRLAFNMENKFAIFVTYLAHLLNGNIATDLLSIGGKTTKTGPNPPPPAHAGGFNVHGTFEGKGTSEFVDMKDVHSTF